MFKKPSTRHREPNDDLNWNFKSTNILVTLKIFINTVHQRELNYNVFLIACLTVSYFIIRVFNYLSGFYLFKIIVVIKTNNLKLFLIYFESKCIPTSSFLFAV